MQKKKYPTSYRALEYGHYRVLLEAASLIPMIQLREHKGLIEAVVSILLLVEPELGRGNADVLHLVRQEKSEADRGIEAGYVVRAVKALFRVWET